MNPSGSIPIFLASRTPGTRCRVPRGFGVDVPRLPTYQIYLAAPLGRDGAFERIERAEVFPFSSMGFQVTRGDHPPVVPNLKILGVL